MAIIFSKPHRLTNNLDILQLNDLYKLNTAIIINIKYYMRISVADPVFICGQFFFFHQILL